MAAIGVAFHHFLRGEGVVGSGWMGRAQRLLQDEPDNVEHGYAWVFELEAGLDGPDPAAVIADARWVKEIGRRHGDPNLVAVGCLFEGRVLVKQGRVVEGMALLDGAMLAVLSEELRPEWAGSTRRWHPACASSWSSQGCPAPRRATWPTRWRRCCTR